MRIFIWPVNRIMPVHVAWQLKTGFIWARCDWWDIWLSVILENFNQWSPLFSIRPCKSLERYGFKLNLRIKCRKDVLGMDTSWTACCYFRQLTNIRATLISFWSVTDVWEPPVFDALTTERFMKFISDTLNCQTYWWKTVKCFPPRCAH